MSNHIENADIVFPLQYKDIPASDRLMLIQSEQGQKVAKDAMRGVLDDLEFPVKERFIQLSLDHARMILRAARKAGLSVEMEFLDDIPPR